MTRDLKDKNILFIAPQTFGYEIEIAAELRRQGAVVDYLPDRPFTSPFMKAVMRFRRDWVLPFADRFVLNSIKAFDRERYDYVFVIGGEGLSVDNLKLMRTSFPSATFVLYLWDALRNKRLLDRNLPFFDHCITFDTDDAKTYGMKFRPLFFTPGFAHERNAECKYQLSFVGTAHSDRVRIVSNIANSLPGGTAFYRYLYLQAPWMYDFHKLTNSAYKGVSRDQFEFLPLKKAEVQGIFFDSLAVLDIEHPKQTGLTMRTFETIGARKKLITTNAAVRNYDFFNPENVIVVKRDATPDIPSSFFHTEYVDPGEDLYGKYSLAGWLRDTIGAG